MRAADNERSASLVRWKQLEGKSVMILLARHLGFCSLLFLSFSVLGCGQQQHQQQETNKLIDEINAARVKSQTLLEQAEEKRAEAKKKLDDNGERIESEKLIEEAASLYGQIAEQFNQSADKAEQIVKLNNPDWYKDYFTLQSKLIRNLAKSASGAREELLLRKNGAPGEGQLKSWKEEISKRSKENQELRKEISRIEAEQGTSLIKQD
jgi:hypothetical protein